jgi:hypothetical protein
MNNPGLDGKTFQVHVESLEAAATTLDSLADLAEKTMIADMQAKLNIGAQAGGSSGQSQADVIFGTFTAAREVSAKQTAYYQSAHSSTQELVKRLRDTAEGTRRLAANYRNAEEASRAAVKDVERLLTSGTGSATSHASSSSDPGLPVTSTSSSSPSRAGGSREGGF